MRWMEEAWRHVGLREIEGTEAAPEIVNFFRDAGRSDVTSDEVAWCAAFVNACLARSGVSLAAIPSGERLLARSCLKLGTRIDVPRVGAVAVFTRGSDPTKGHVVFITGWTDQEIVGLSGNKANAVSVDRYPRASLVGMVWPEVPVTAKDLAADGSRIAAAAQRQVRDAAKAGGGLVMPSPPDLSAVGQAASQMHGAMEQVTGFVAYAWGKSPVILAVCVVYWFSRMAYDAWVIKQARVEDANTGKTVAEPSDDEVIHVQAA